MKIPDEDLKITSERKGSVGGQQVGCVKMDVTIEHIPTGIKATVGDQRSQLKNKMVALGMIEWGLIEIGYVYKEEQNIL